MKQVDEKQNREKQKTREKKITEGETLSVIIGEQKW